MSSVQVSDTAAQTLAELRDGVRDILPPLLACVPIGLVFGAVAAAKGLSVAEVALMSATVFAGGAQFAAIELWTDPAPVAALAMSTALINARLTLMSASLSRRTGAFAPWQKLLAYFALADENWAFAERRGAERVLTPAYMLGAAAVFWTNWVVCSTLGALGGAALGDPKTYGADFAFTAVFIGLVAGFVRSRSAAAVVAASAAASAGVCLLIGPPWHVASGAAAGIGMAWILAGKAPR